MKCSTSCKGPSKPGPSKPGPSKPQGYIGIARNVYAKGPTPVKKGQGHRHRAVEADPCQCSNSQSCSADCLCASTQTTCTKLCPCEGGCHNIAFQKRRRKKIGPVKTENCGWGAKALEDLASGDFVIEYVGEVIDSEMCEKRLRQQTKRGDENFYIVKINRDTIIDATYRGNLARLINHGCEPNCEMQKWDMDGRTRIGIFALQDIPRGTHLSYDYRFVEVGDGKGQVCRCGAEACRGMLGTKTQKKSKRPTNESAPETQKKAKRPTNESAPEPPRTPELSEAKARNQPRRTDNSSPSAAVKSGGGKRKREAVPEEGSAEAEGSGRVRKRLRSSLVSGLAGGVNSLEAKQKPQMRGLDGARGLRAPRGMRKTRAKENVPPVGSEAAEEEEFQRILKEVQAEVLAMAEAQLMAPPSADMAVSQKAAAEQPKDVRGSRKGRKMGTFSDMDASGRRHSKRTCVLKQKARRGNGTISVIDLTHSDSETDIAYSEGHEETKTVTDGDKNVKETRPEGGSKHGRRSMEGRDEKTMPIQHATRCLRASKR